MSEDELPDGWLLAALTDICDINPRRPDLAHLDPNASVTFVPMPAVDAQRGAITNAVLRPLVEVRKGFTSFRDDDVIMAKITPCMENGKAAIARGLANGLGFGSTEFHVLRSYGAVLPEYFYYFVRQDSFRASAASEMTGSVGQKRVPASFLEGTSIPLPPLAEQKRIVAKIEELLARVSAARERLAKVPAILKRFRQAVLAAACSGRLTADWRDDRRDTDDAESLLRKIDELRNRRDSANVRSKASTPSDEADFDEEGRDGADVELPISWVRCRIEQIATVCLGGTPSRKKPSYWDGAVPWVSSGEVANCRIATTRERITETGLQNSNAKVSPVGTVLVAMIGEGRTRGQTAVLDIEAATNQNVAALVFDAGQIEPRRWALAEYERHRGGGRGGNYPAINGRIVRNFAIPLPPYSEQVEIADRLDCLFGLIEAIESRAVAAQQRAEKLVESMLAKAFRGELVPTEADLARQEGRDYEPASVLLERIRLERATLENGAPALRRKPQGASAAKYTAVADNRPDAPENADEPTPASDGGDVIERTPDLAPCANKTNGKRRGQPLLAPAPIDQTDRNEVLAVIRQVFSDGERRHRATAIHDVAHALGYHRTGARIHEILNTDLLTAVRRGILGNERGELRLLCRSADAYTLDHRVEMLVAAMGTGWQTRDDAITAAARHLGFRRTGPALRAAFKSAINAALRRNRIERGDAQRVRRTR